MPNVRKEYSEEFRIPVVEELEAAAEAAVVNAAVLPGAGWLPRFCDSAFIPKNNSAY